jgi:catechol 2,3-dioxygenase-like lactoylglutathione lyase family enzyme
MTVLPHLHHVGATVADLERSVAFYTGVLDCTVVHRFDSGGDARIRALVGVPDATVRGAMLETAAGVRVELLSYDSAHCRTHDTRPCDAPAPHLAFVVADLPASLDRVRDGGGRLVGEPVRLNTGMFAYCSDPDGNLLELIELDGEP